MTLLKIISEVIVYWFNRHTEELKYGEMVTVNCEDKKKTHGPIRTVWLTVSDLIVRTGGTQVVTLF